MSHLEISLLVFYTVLFVLILCPLSYPKEERRMYLIERKSIWKDWRILMPCFIYAIVLGYRYDYAYDWDQYMNTFNYIQKGQLYREDTEVGYLVINRILGLIGGDYYSIFILEGFVWVFAFCYIFRHNRKMLLWVLPIVYLGTRFRCLNLSRQHFAMSVFFLAFAFLNEGKKKYFWITSLVACSIHTSAIVYVLPFYFITMYREKIKIPKQIITLIIYVVVVIFTEIVISKFLELADVVTLYLGKGYDAERLLADRFQWELTTRQKIVNGAKDIITILCIYKFKDKIPRNGNIYLIFILGLLGCLIRPIGESHEIFSRMFLYFVVFTHVAFACCCYYIFRHLKQVPIWIVCLSLINIAQYLWGMYGQIVREVKELGIFIEYR